MIMSTHDTTLTGHAFHLVKLLGLEAVHQQKNLLSTCSLAASNVRSRLVHKTTHPQWGSPIVNGEFELVLNPLRKCKPRQYAKSIYLNFLNPFISSQELGNSASYDAYNDALPV